MHINTKKYLLLLNLLLIIYSSIICAETTRTITINNQCDFDVLIGNIGVPIIVNNKTINCDKPYTYCYSGNGVCGDDNICYFKSLTLKLGDDQLPEYYLRKQSTKIYSVDLINTGDNQQYILNIAAQYQCTTQGNDSIELSPADFSDTNTNNSDINSVVNTVEPETAKGINEKNYITSVAEKTEDTTVSITFQHLDIKIDDGTEKVQNIEPKDNTDQQQSFNIQAVKKSNPNILYQCISADCNRSTANLINGRCTPNSSFYGPYTSAYIELNNNSNDRYFISIENGINVPISITPVGEFGEQDIQSNFFCKTTGGTIDNDPTNLTGCSWDFTPLENDIIKRHLFLQINRNLDADVVSLCQSDSECNHGEVCGLKYPEDLISYSGSGYCGSPVAIQTVKNICNTNNLSSTITDILKCENFDSKGNFIIDANDIGTLLKNSVDERCPNSNIELTLNDEDKTKVKFCIHDLYNCNSKELSISGKYHKYLDSCYNYNHDSKEIGICCGCIDWPNIPSDNNFLCLPSTETTLPVNCDVDLASSPPNCKPKYTTKVTKSNETWSKLVKPHLEWLIKGCPDAKEYTYGDKHSMVQCSSQNIASTPGNNINYLITFCPNNKNLFDGGSNKQDKFLKDFVATNKIIDSDNTETKSQLFSDYKITINLSNAIIFLIFSIVTILLIAYFAFKRDN